jgi:hypothetical protein
MDDVFHSRRLTNTGLISEFRQRAAMMLDRTGAESLLKSADVSLDRSE